MGKLRSIAIFYRRGVPDSAFLFGIAVQRNYTIASVSAEYKYNLGLKNRFPRPMLRTSR